MKLTTKQEDLILEEGREEDYNDIDIEMDEGYICPSCKVMGRGEMKSFEVEESPCVVFECECGHEEAIL